ncbi:MAG: VCBS repeat-containing protein [Deltaproteobacteria bacterium]|nr:VCBS repeat-containing protein [Deltaproteobacteria bacterium]
MVTAPIDPAKPYARRRLPGTANEGFCRFVVVVIAAVLSLISAPPAQGLDLSMDAHSLPVNDNPQGLNAVDCDGDLLPDLISANFDSDTVTVFQNSGPGTLLHGANLATADEPSGATCADFNNDGRIDAAVSSWKQKTVTLYIRQEDGSYTVGASSPVGNLPRSVSAADLNLDGNVDLVVVNVQSSDLTLLFGNGAGGFAAVGNIRIPRLSPQASRPVSAQIADFNGDSLPDIVVAANQQDPSLHLLLGDGFGFHFAPNPLPSTDRLLYVAAGDVNGDDLMDIATLGVDATIKVFAGHGNGTFTLLSVLLAGSMAKTVALADFDGDGLTDLAVSYSDSNSVQILRGISPGNFQSPYNIASPTVVSPMATARLRISATGGSEIVFVDGVAQRLSLLQILQLTGPTVSPLADLVGTPESLLLTDMTNDGIPDAVVASAGPKSSLGITVMRGNAAGSFDPPPPPVSCGNAVLDAGESCDDANAKKGDGCSVTCLVEMVKTLFSMDAADFNGDGNKDLAAVDAKGDLRIFLGNGIGQFGTIALLAKVKRKTGATVGDFNGDGLPDLAIVPRVRSGGSVTLLLNDGIGSFIPLPIIAPAKLGGPILAGDFDRNGFDDLLAVQTSKPKGVMLLSSDGAGPLRLFQTTPTPAGIVALAAADFDENGYLDTVAEFKGKKQHPILLLGALGGPFLAGPLIPSAPSPSRFSIADVDEDLHQDLLSCTPATSPNCQILYGTGRGTFAANPLPAAPSIGRDVRGAAADDFDDDGHVDLAGVSRQDSRLVVHFAGPSPSSLVLETGQLPEALATTDLNDDGRQDLLVANAGSQDISIFINQGARQFVTLVRTKLPLGNGHVSMAVGDIDGDGKKDLAVTQSESNRLTILSNTGGAGFAVQANLATQREPRGVAIGKLNGDDIGDIVTANRGANSVSIFRSETNGSYTRTDMASQGFAPWDVVLPDLDGDTVDDLVVLNEFDTAPVATKTATPTPIITPTPEATSTSAATGSGAPTPTATAQMPTPTPSTDSQEGNLITFLNDGTGGFPAVTERHTRGRQTPIAMCVGDFNGDTVPDLAVASVTTNDIMVLHGSGDGFWSGDERDFPVGNPVGGLSCHDADSDGRTDVAFARRRSNDVGAILTGPQ